MASVCGEYLKYLSHFRHTVTVRELAARPDMQAVALRHDVDHDINLALEMAWLEADHGIRSTYYILHTAPYFTDPLLGEKCRQIELLGHEVGMHNNVLAEFLHTGVSADEICTNVLSQMRSWGVRVDGVSGHGDPLCYAHGFLNHCFFKEGNDRFNRTGGIFTAEGMSDPARHDNITLSGAKQFEALGRTCDLGVRTLNEMGIVYDANLIQLDHYLSDSRGQWNLDPLEMDLSAVRCEINIHPVHYRAPARKFFFLACARSGSKWLAKVLNETTTVQTGHEFMLNRFREGEETVRDYFTGAGFEERLKDTEDVRRRMVDWKRIHDADDPAADRAEVNVYLVHALDALRETYPYAKVIHLHRDGRKVAKSLFTRGWYDSPDDTHHPHVESPGPEPKTPFEECAAYWSWAVNRLSGRALPQMPLETLTSDPDEAFKMLASVGIRVVLPSRFRALCQSVVDPTQESKLPEPDLWTPEVMNAFDRVAGPAMQRLGYQRAASDENTLGLITSLPEKLQTSAAWVPEQETLFELRGTPSATPPQGTLAKLTYPIWEYFRAPKAKSANEDKREAFHVDASSDAGPISKLLVSATPGCEYTVGSTLDFTLRGRWKHWAVLGTSNWHTVVPSSIVPCHTTAYMTTNFSVAEMRNVSLITFRHLYFDEQGALITPYSRCFNFSRSFMNHAPACKLSTCPPERARYVTLGFNFDLGTETQGAVSFSRLTFSLFKQELAA